MTIWDKLDSVSVIVLPSGSVGDRLFNAAQEWVHARLLEPALWVRPEDIVGSQTVGPPQIQAQVIGRNGGRSVGLFEELSRKEFELLRVVAVRTLVTEGLVLTEQSQSQGLAIDYSERQLFAADQTQDRQLKILTRYLESSIPLADDNGSDFKGTKLRKINLVFGSTEEVDADLKQFFTPVWDVNVVVSPEDRQTASSFDRFTSRDSDAFYRFMLANIATTSGIWAGNRQSLWDPANQNSDYLKQRIMFQRSFVRAVFIGGLAVRVAAEALIAAIDPNKLLEDEESGLVYLPSNLVPERIAKMLRLAMALDNGKLSYRRLPRPAEVKRQRKGLIRAFLDYVNFMWEMTKALPGWIVDFYAEKFSRKATNLLYGEDGDTEVDLGIELGSSRSAYDRKLASQAARIKRRQTQLRSDLESERPVAVSAIHPELWRGLRNIVLGSLDGRDQLQGVAEDPKIEIDTEFLEFPSTRTLWRRISDPIIKLFRGEVSAAVAGAQKRDAPLEVKPVEPLFVGAESLIADVSLVCPDPLDLWIPVTEVENQIGSIPIADQSNDPFDMRSSSAWEKRLGQRIHDLTSHIAKYSEVLTAATSERIRVEDQLAELELELELLRGRKVDLEAEGSTLTPVPSVEDVSDGVGVEADAENVEPIEEDQPMKDSTRDPASHETIEPAQGGEVTQVPAVDQIDSENDVNLEEKSAAEASLAQEVNQ